MENEARSAKTYRRGDQYCVGGLPNGKPCTSRSGTASFSKNPEVRSKWTVFVRRYRVNFDSETYSKEPFLCSLHFNPFCFSKALVSNFGDFDAEHSKRFFLREAMPTLHNPPQEETSYSSREKRRLVKEAMHATLKFNDDKASSTNEASPILTTEPDHEESIFDVEACPLHLSCAPMTGCPTCCDAVGETLALPNSKNKSVEAKLPCSRCKFYMQEKDSMKKKEKRLNCKIEKLKDEIVFLKTCLAKQTSPNNEAEAPEAKKDQFAAGIDSGDESDVFSDGDEDDIFDLNMTSESDLEKDDDEDDVDNGHLFDATPRSYIRVDPATPKEEEPKFIVFYSMLMNLLSMFCFKCKDNSPTVNLLKNGTMITAIQSCNRCGKDSFVWRSQPFIFGRYPAGNVLLSFGILAAGASVSKVLLVCRHLGLMTYQARTLFLHQRNFIFPSIIRHWQLYCSTTLNQVLQLSDRIIVCGDGRFDSMGHSAKYGSYTFFCENIMKIVHFELVQANECKSSTGMELVGCQRGIEFLKNKEVPISVFVSDRHTGIAKWIRDSEKQLKHYFDIWHVARTITKKLLKAGKEKDCERISEWASSIRNHLYWCVTSTKEGFHELIEAKWKSVIRHIANEHENHPDPLYKNCKHEKLRKRHWIKNGTVAHDKLKAILLDKRLLNGIRQLSPMVQTSCLEGYHSTLNQWHPKMLHFQWIGTFCRHILAICHFNENLKRDIQKKADGTEVMRISWPKFKLGEESVRKVPVAPTYEYVDTIRKLMFTIQKAECNEIMKQYERIAPLPLTSQFKDRLPKLEAVQKYLERNQSTTSMYPTEREQSGQQELLLHQEQSTANRKRKAPKCKVCNQPKKGHPKKKCQK